MAEETRVEGNVSGHIYLKYFRAGSSILLLVVILVLSVIAEVSQRWKASNTHTHTPTVQNAHSLTQ